MKKLFLFSGLCALATLPIACGRATEAAPMTEDRAIAVQTLPVTFRTSSPTVEYPGLIAALDESRLSFKIGGMVSHIYVKEGDHVHAGQLLARLDPTEIDAQVRQAGENVAKAERDASRVKSLFEDTAATEEQYQNVQTQLSVAREGLKIAQFNRTFSEIRSGQEGTVIKKFMNEGETVAPGTPILLVSGTGPNQWVIRFGVSDRDWARLRMGSPATVRMDAYPGETFSGKISKIQEAADPSSGTYEIEVQVLPQGKKLAPGLFATVSLQPAAGKPVAILPVEVLSEGDEKKGFVYTINPDSQTVTRHPVTIAFLGKDSVAISSGLEGIGTVIGAGAQYLTPTSTIKLKNSGL